MQLIMVMKIPWSKKLNMASNKNAMRSGVGVFYMLDTCMYSMVSPSIISYIHLLSYLSSCTNPITYCLMHKKFREALMMLCRNGGSPNRYAISDLDQSSSTNQSYSAGTNSTGAFVTLRLALAIVYLELEVQFLFNQDLLHTDR
ncbi:unnamed protein product [Medioppia subpectinata]|uniref:G-protein coupled receptors family 1 profile domain-containing protein n=1 Tax=Medioppia subpectinata TaxID=1979941 RepID=A0A7R9L2L3_9ACAR|nr:unnamed protein product [Medioppia subpectinata]CAG2114401.1 unnamed protein product [Medioppia subpectinata]